MNRKILFLSIFLVSVIAFLIIKRNKSNMPSIQVGKYQEGNTIRTIETSLFDDCKKFCDDDPKCAGFTNSWNGTCELKSSFSNIIDKKGYTLYKK